jgi:hypothetical protein
VKVGEVSNQQLSDAINSAAATAAANSSAKSNGVALLDTSANSVLGSGSGRSRKTLVFTVCLRTLIVV